MSRFELNQFISKEVTENPALEEELTADDGQSITKQNNAKETIKSQIYFNARACAFKPDQSFSENKDQLNIRSNLHSKVEFNLSEYWDITPTIVFQKQNAYQQILFGSFADFDISNFYSKNIELELGLFHRWRDAISILMGAKFKNTSVTLSYDWNISDLVPASNGIGAWEISFIHIINNIISRPNSYKVCPIYL